MIVVRGKRAGTRGRLVQFCNDWVMADLDDGSAFVGSPTSVLLDDFAEVAAVRASQDVGTMWQQFTLSDDGVFARRPRAV